MNMKPFEHCDIQRKINEVTMPIKRKRIKWCRNWPCLCGSNKKYKKCCMSDIDNLTTIDANAIVENLPDNIARIVGQNRGENKNENK